MLAKTTSAALAGKVAAALAAVAILVPLAITSPLGAGAEQSAAGPVKPLCHGPHCGG